MDRAVEPAEAPEGQKPRDDRHQRGQHGKATYPRDAQADAQAGRQHAEHDDLTHVTGGLVFDPAAGRGLKQDEQAQAQHQRRQHDRDVQDRVDDRLAGELRPGQQIARGDRHPQRQQRGDEARHEAEPDGVADFPGLQGIPEVAGRGEKQVGRQHREDQADIQGGDHPQAQVEPQRGPGRPHFFDPLPVKPKPSSMKRAFDSAEWSRSISLAARACCSLSRAIATGWVGVAHRMPLIGT